MEEDPAKTIKIKKAIERRKKKSTAGKIYCRRI
jgi:hypothetical protein